MYKPTYVKQVVDFHVYSSEKYQKANMEAYDKLYEDTFNGELVSLEKRGEGGSILGAVLFAILLALSHMFGEWLGRKLAKRRFDREFKKRYSDWGRKAEESFRKTIDPIHVSKEHITTLARAGICIREYTPDVELQADTQPIYPDMRFSTKPDNLRWIDNVGDFYQTIESLFKSDPVTVAEKLKEKCERVSSSDYDKALLFCKDMVPMIGRLPAVAVNKDGKFIVLQQFWELRKYAADVPEEGEKVDKRKLSDIIHIQRSNYLDKLARLDEHRAQLVKMLKDRVDAILALGENATEKDKLEAESLKEVSQVITARPFEFITSYAQDTLKKTQNILAQIAKQNNIQL